MTITLMFIICCLGWLVPAPSEALTVEEILLLKQNGVSEGTIQMMLQSEIQARSLQSRATGQTMGIEPSPPQAAGNALATAVQTITRSGGQSAIFYTTGSADHDSRRAEERLKEERAWEMLRHIIVDTRNTKDRGPRPED